MRALVRHGKVIELGIGYDGGPVLLSHIADENSGNALCTGAPFVPPHSFSPPTIICPGCIIYYRSDKYK